MTEDAGSIFDRPIDRRNTRSLKWDRTPDGTRREGLLPMWVADMDFQTAPEILAAFTRLVDHGVFGYTGVPESLPDAYIRWVEARQGASLPPGWLLHTRGVLESLAMSISTLTEKGDSVVIQPPVYYPFASIITGNGRQVVENPLHEAEGRYSFDFDHLQRVAEGAKALILCSPHNPVGRVWTVEELRTLVEICRRRKILIISDEIHSDLIMPGYGHTPLYNLAEGNDDPMVVLTSPTKTFNLAAVAMAWMIVPDQNIRKKLMSAERNAHSRLGDVFAITAAEAAYTKGAAWVDALIDYLAENDRVLRRELVGNVPGLRISPLEGTYLAWMDFRAVSVQGTGLSETMLDEAGLWLSNGDIFGTGGTGFQRLNLATPRSRVVEAAARIRETFG